MHRRGRPEVAAEATRETGKASAVQAAGADSGDGKQHSAIDCRGPGKMRATYVTMLDLRNARQYDAP